MSKITLPLLLASSLFVIGCGGGGSETNSGGTGGTGNPRTGGDGTIPQDFVQNLTCTNSTPFGTKTVTVKGGSEGSISVSCDPNDYYSYSLGSTNSLNITDGNIINTVVLKCDSGETKTVTDIDLNNIDSQSVVKTYSSNTETNEEVSCKSTYSSPLPTTITTDESIDDLIHFLIRGSVTGINSDCPTTMPSINLTSVDNCKLSKTVNIKLYEGPTITHKATYLYNMK